MKDYQPGSPQYLGEELASMRGGLRVIDECPAFSYEMRIERRRRVFEKAKRIGIFPMLAEPDAPPKENPVAVEAEGGRRVCLPVRGGVED